MLSKYVYGRVPTNVPKVTWTVTAVDHEMIGFTPVIAKDLIGEVDNSAYPGDQREDPHDAGDAGAARRGRSGADDVWPGRVSGAARADGRGARPHQHCLEGAAGAAGPLAEGCFCPASGLAAGEGDALSISAS